MFGARLRYSSLLVQASHTPPWCGGSSQLFGDFANTDLICQAKGKPGQAPVPTPTLEINKQTWNKPIHHHFFLNFWSPPFPKKCWRNFWTTQGLWIETSKLISLYASQLAHNIERRESFSFTIRRLTDWMLHNGATPFWSVIWNIIRSKDFTYVRPRY